MSESRRLQIRVDDEFRAKLEEAAAAKKLNVSEWVRGVLERALRAKSNVKPGRPKGQGQGSRQRSSRAT